MRAVAVISARRGADPDLARRQDDLLGSLGYRMRHAFDEAAVRVAMRRDKKREAGRQRWILPMEIGRVIEVDDVTSREVSAALKAIRT
jgi:shikimate kinase/3-dehydroquinate synthase